MKIAIDFAANKIVIASTFTVDFHFDPPFPGASLVSFNSAWTFDPASIKFYFGGRSGWPRTSIIPAQLTIWDTYLPISGGTTYPGLLILGHERKRVIRVALCLFV